MEISDSLRCVFSAQIGERNGSYVINVPDRELQLGNLQQDETYRIAVLSADAQTKETGDTHSESDHSIQSPPVEKGDTRTVDIDDIGEQGDGVARVERGFVVIIPDTELGERVTVEITDVSERVAFAEVVERVNYYE